MILASFGHCSEVPTRGREANPADYGVSDDPAVQWLEQGCPFESFREGNGTNRRLLTPNQVSFAAMECVCVLLRVSLLGGSVDLKICRQKSVHGWLA